MSARRAKPRLRRCSPTPGSRCRSTPRWSSASAHVCSRRSAGCRAWTSRRAGQTSMGGHAASRVRSVRRARRARDPGSKLSSRRRSDAKPASDHGRGAGRKQSARGGAGRGAFRVIGPAARAGCLLLLAVTGCGGAPTVLRSYGARSVEGRTIRARSLRGVLARRDRGGFGRLEGRARGVRASASIRSTGPRSAGSDGCRPMRSRPARRPGRRRLRVGAGDRSDVRPSMGRPRQVRLDAGKRSPGSCGRVPCARSRRARRRGCGPRARPHLRRRRGRSGAGRARRSSRHRRGSRRGVERESAPGERSMATRRFGPRGPWASRASRRPDATRRRGSRSAWPGSGSRALRA